MLVSDSAPLDDEVADETEEEDDVDEEEAEDEDEDDMDEALEWLVRSDEVADVVVQLVAVA